MTGTKDLSHVLSYIEAMDRLEYKVEKMMSTTNKYIERIKKCEKRDSRASRAGRNISTNS